MPACKFLSSLQLGVRDGFREKAACKLGCGALCIWRASQEAESLYPGSECRVRNVGSQLS